MKHPLISKDGAHYSSTKEPAIKQFEREFTVGELLAWAKITKAKYDHPARANKGQVEADRRKSKTYGDYYEFLLGIVRKSPHFKDISAERAYDILGIKLIY